MALSEPLVREATGWLFFGGTSRQRKREILCVLRVSVVNYFFTFSNRQTDISESFAENNPFSKVVRIKDHPKDLTVYKSIAENMTP
jgi:hypothetical protein